MTIKTLRSVAQVLRGYSFRESVQNSSKGTALIQIKDIKGMYIHDCLLKKVAKPPQSARYILRGDVLMSTRAYFKSAVFNAKKPAITSAVISIIRLKDDSILPEYLSVILNSSLIQTYLHKITSGATMRQLKTVDLEELQIPIVGLKQQHIIVHLTLNVERQNSLSEIKQRYVNEIYNSAIQKQLKEAI